LNPAFANAAADVVTESVGPGTPEYQDLELASPDEAESKFVDSQGIVERSLRLLKQEI